MTGLLDLERQGYGFQAARLCFKAHACDLRHNFAVWHRYAFNDLIFPECEKVLIRDSGFCGLAQYISAGNAEMSQCAGGLVDHDAARINDLPELG